MNEPAETTEPLYHLAPAWALLPLVLLATAATVIASQAVISGAFSLTHQAIQLGLCPRLRILQSCNAANRLPSQAQHRVANRDRSAMHTVYGIRRRRRVAPPEPSTPAPNR